jgi:hypothetical protein
VAGPFFQEDAMLKTFTLILGLVLLLVGVLGFVLTPGDGLILGIFAANTTHHVIHLTSGILGIAAATMGWSRTFCQIFGPVYLLVGILGLALVGSDGMLLGMVHVNTADHFLHLAIGAAASYFGFLAPATART